MPSQDFFLSDQEVCDRLKLCTNETMNDAYAFGQKLADQALERVRNVERKATLFAAYGIGVVTLLTSTFSTWANAGNRHTLWISVLVSVCAVFCTYFAINVLRLKELSFTSEDDWLRKEFLNDVRALKEYRIRTLWGDIDSRFRQQYDQAKELRCAELSLLFSGFSLLSLLVHLAFLQLLGHRIETLKSVKLWGMVSVNWSAIGDTFAFAFIGGILFCFAVGIRRICVFHDADNYKSHEENE
jgi:hypothetical protein